MKSLVLFLLLGVALSNLVQASAQTRRKAPKFTLVQKTEEEVVNETLSLLNSGNEEINIGNDFQDFVLLLGNTGAGKTTMTKLMADIDNLEAYNNGDRFLIRDRDQKIGHASTIVSKTIFPDLIVDEGTQTAFYDLPGFSDTRNASIEVANSWFMKRVADEARRVKLLFVVNYSSLRSGESRTDFKTLLEHAVAFVKEPSKFRNSMALVCTKVETSRDDKELLAGIKGFLQLARGDLDKIFEDPEMLSRAQDLVHNFLSEDSNGVLDKVTFFRQPTKPGPLASMPGMMAQVNWLKETVSRLEYEPKTDEDFGVSMSSSAELLINKLGLNLIQKISSEITKVGAEIQEFFQNRSTMVAPSTVASAAELYHDFENFILTMEQNSKRSSFASSLQNLALNYDVPDIYISEVENNLRILKFFEQVTEVPILLPLSDWTSILKEVVLHAQAIVKQMAADLNLQVQATMESETLLFKDNLQAFAQNPPCLTKGMKALGDILNLTLGHISSALSSRTFNEFSEKMRATLQYQDIRPDLTLSELPDLRLDSWVRPLETLVPFIQFHIHALTTKMRDQKNQEAINRLADSMTQLQAQMSLNAQEREAEFQRFQRNATLEQEAMNEEIEEQRALFRASLIRQQEEYQLALLTMQLRAEAASQELERRLREQQVSYNQLNQALRQQNRNLETQMRIELERSEQLTRENQRQSQRLLSNLRDLQRTLSSLRG